jgi:hypothetical protein
MIASKLLLSILRAEYETAALGEWVTSRQADVEEGTEEVRQPRKELDPQSLHIGRMDLVIEGHFRGSSGSVRCYGRTGRAAQNWHGTTYAALDSAKEGRSGLATQRWPQAPRDGYSGLDFKQDWTDHKPISRSSVKPRDAGDCMMNES